MDPLSLGALGAVAATEGVKFLYGQAAEVLKRWRDRKAGKDADAHSAIPLTGAEVLEGKLNPPIVDFDAVGRLHEDITKLAGVLGNYAAGLEEPDPNDRELTEAADGLRRALEVIYGQRITFKGEDRAPSGPIVVGRAEVDRVAGDVAGVRARLARSGRIHGEVKSTVVEHGATASGVEIDEIG